MVAENETRTLKIHHTHTGEDITVTFKRNGRYDEQGLAQLNHFLRDWRNDQKTKMDPQLFDIVWEVYQDVGAREPIQIISAYRSPATNAMLRSRSRGVAQFSQHMLGKAIDFNIPGVSLDKVRAAGLRMQRGGVGFYPSSGSPFVHVDVGSVRHWPRMTHDQLVRVFPNGRTVHLPSDGRPLAGYELALADLERRGSSVSRMVVASNDDRQSGETPKRSLLSRLFGVGGNDEDDVETSAPARRGAAGRGKPVEESESAKTSQVASLVPMPRVRPLAREPQYEVAAAAVVLVSAPGTAAAAVQSRGIWTGRQAQAAAAEPAPAPRERLVWQTGPQPQQGRTVMASAAEGATIPAAPLPRPRPSFALASAGPETTASLPPWPISQRRNDRIPSDLVLAYAAQAPVATDPPAVRAAPMGALRPNQNQSVAVRTAPPAAAAAKGAAPTPQPKRLVENPWLRGVMLSPSIHASMDVATTGIVNYRELARFMQKPASALAVGFTDEPMADGPQTFSGSAVAFLPTVTFGKITASLN